MQLARVGVRVLVVDVVCVMLVLIAHVVHAVSTVFVASFLSLEMYSLQSHVRAVVGPAKYRPHLVHEVVYCSDRGRSGCIVVI